MCVFAVYFYFTIFSTNTVIIIYFIFLSYVLWCKAQPHRELDRVIARVCYFLKTERGPMFGLFCEVSDYSKRFNTKAAGSSPYARVKEHLKQVWPKSNSLSFPSLLKFYFIIHNKLWQGEHIVIKNFSRYFSGNIRFGVPWWKHVN